MTYWTVIANESERDKRPSKVFKQINKPGVNTARVKGYPWIHGCATKKDAIKHLDAMKVPNSMRPPGYKSYDI
jgi:hypothetical protein